MNLRRQETLFNPTNIPAHVWIIGCGNIGSNVAVALVRMGLTSFSLFDADTVDDVNLTTQHYLPEHLNFHKTIALSQEMQKVNHEVDVETFEIFVDHEASVVSAKTPTLIISGVDSLPARRSIKEACTEYDVPVIDGRMGKQQIEVHYFDSPTEWTIPADGDNIMEDICTEKFIIYTPMMITALIADTVKKIMLKETPAKIQRYEFQNNIHLITR